MAKAPVPKPKFNPARAPEGLETAEPQTADESSPAAQRARSYKGTEQVDHDLFKLENAFLKRDLSYGGDAPLIDHITHSHHFHTVDSNGKKLDTSTSVGGHFHPVNVRMSESGVPEISVGAPMKWVARMQGKRRVKVMTAVAFDGLDDDGNPIVDNHTHKVSYLGSEKVTIRQASIEAAKYTAAINMKRETTVEGVQAK
jgi:hypothetical protein